MSLVILVIAAWAAATVSGTTGFGGALLLLPVLTFTEGARAAVPVLTVAQLFGNGSRAWFGRSEIAWRAVWRFTAGSAPGAVGGAMLFTELPAPWAGRLIGGVMVALAIFRRTSMGSRPVPESWLFPAGLVLGWLSALVGSVGPLQALVFLGLGLPPTAFIATEAVAAGLLHLTKAALYGRFALLTWEQLGLALLLGAAMVVGSWTGRRVLERVSPQTLQAVIEVALFVSGLVLIFS